MATQATTSAAEASSSRLSLLVHLLDQAYDKKAWHGPTLRGALRGVSPAVALYRPAPGRNSIWELALHAAYWKYAVSRQLSGSERGSFPLAGSNFFPQPAAADEGEWRAALQVLAGAHRRLRQAVLALDEASLDGRPAASKYSRAELVVGAASHDLYHAGQISLLKRLATA